MRRLLGSNCQDKLWIHNCDGETDADTVLESLEIPGPDNSPDRGIGQHGLGHRSKPGAITRSFLSGGKAIWSEKVDDSYR
jgi:hypothetical protein